MVESFQEEENEKELQTLELAKQLQVNDKFLPYVDYFLFVTWLYLCLRKLKN